MLSTIILDRDGVINHDSAAYIKSPAEWQAIDGSVDAIARLKQAGLRIVVATNQSGLGRGLFSSADLHAIHEKMAALLRAQGTVLDGIFFCPHAPWENCGCRKPQPGLLEAIMHRWHLKAEECVMVGDSPTDIAAAQAVGISALGVRSGKPISAEAPIWRDVPLFDDLASTADSLLLTYRRK